MLDKDSIVIFGAGGHAKVVIDVLRSRNRPVTACLGLEPSEPVLGVPVFAGSAAAGELLAQGITRAFVAIGDNTLRQREAERAVGLGFQLVRAISPTAYVAPSVSLGAGVLIVHGAVVNADAKIGDNVIINTGATVDHDNVIGAGVHIGPGSHLAGWVNVGAGAFVGAGAVVIPGISIGTHAVVGAGAVVVRDVVSQHRVWGNPARDKGSITLVD